MSEWIPLGVSVVLLAMVWFAVGRIGPGNGRGPSRGPQRNARGDDSSSAGGCGDGGSAGDS
ncbi:hypothetical protein [Mycobacterium sp. Root265]|uniref:hypothetical protein n=1 Tax=Mycobacterium sp. Root265 TaxID=1736504 RepID=UPI0012E3D286|nr:hypothetical protein [Mycobacterium sp. Root265]